MDTVGGFGGEGNILGYKHTQGETLNLTSYVKDKVLKAEQRACKQRSWELGGAPGAEGGHLQGKRVLRGGTAGRRAREALGCEGRGRAPPGPPLEEPAAGSRAPALAPLHLPQTGACFSRPSLPTPEHGGGTPARLLLPGAPCPELSLPSPFPASLLAPCSDGSSQPTVCPPQHTHTHRWKL